MTLCGIGCTSSYIAVDDNLGMLTELRLAPVAADIFELRLPIPWEDEFVNVFLFADGASIDFSTAA